MRIARVVSQPMEVNVWLIEDAGEALVVDAGLGSDVVNLAGALRRAAAGARIEQLFLTHPHCDHVAGAAGLQRELGVEVLIHEADVPTIEKGDAAATLGTLLGVGQEPCPCRGCSEGAHVRVGDLRFEVLRLPGHTPDHGALWHRQTGTLFSGDVVFAHGSFGRTDFPGGDSEALLASLRRLSVLPVQRVFPGHMAPIEHGAQEAIAASLANAEAMLS